MTLLVQEEVFRLQVPIDDMSFVQVVEGTQHSGGVKSRVLLAAVETSLYSHNGRITSDHIAQLDPKEQDDFTKKNGNILGNNDSWDTDYNIVFPDV